MTGTMRFALEVPIFGPYGDVHLLVELAREAEAAGWDGFFLWDHISFGAEALPMIDPWIALSAIAVATSTIKIGAMVTPLPRRRPSKVARETVTLDHLSRGRLIFGVGIGILPNEFEHLGDAGDLKVRAAMLDEALEVLTGLWSGERFQHHGTYYHVEDNCFQPTPYQPQIPIWVAGWWPNKAPFRRAARWNGAFPQGRGYQLHEQMTPEDMAEVRDFIQAHRTNDGPYDLLHLGCTAGTNPAEERAFAASYAAVGVTWWIENLIPTRWKTWEGWWPLIPNPGEGWPLDAMRERIRNGPPR